MKFKLLIFTFIFCLSNYSYAEQEKKEQTGSMSEDEFNTQFNILLDLSQGMIRPLQNCVNLFTGAYGHKENYPQSKVITLDSKEMMSNSAVLQLQIVLYARELGMEDILQDGNEQMQLALAYRKAWDAANDGDLNIAQLMQLNMKICGDLMNIFIFASEIVIPEKE